MVLVSSPPPQKFKQPYSLYVRVCLFSSLVCADTTCVVQPVTHLSNPLPKPCLAAGSIVHAAAELQDSLL